MSPVTEERVIDHLREAYGLIIGELTAARVLSSLDATTVEIRGRDTNSGHPNTITVNADEIRRLR